MARGKIVSTSSSSSSISMDDQDSPYHLHSSDHLGLVLISHQLTGPNFHTWRWAMVMALTAKNKLVFINGMLSHPISTDLLYCVCLRCDSMVSSWLLNSVSKDIADSLLYLDSTSAIWSDLCEHFQQGNGPHIFRSSKVYLLWHKVLLM